MMENDIRQLQDENDLLVVAVEKLTADVEVLSGKMWILQQWFWQEHREWNKAVGDLSYFLEPRDRQTYREVTKAEGVQRKVNEADAI
jgi:hypothetical protein